MVYVIEIVHHAGISLGIQPANERCRYIVTTSLIGWSSISRQTPAMENNNLFVPLSQYHDCWWPGDERNQGISSYGIDIVILEHSSFSTRRVNLSWTETDVFL